MCHHFDSGAGLDLGRLLLAAQLWKLTPVQALRTVLAFLERYREAVVDASRTGEAGEFTLTGGRGPIHDLLGSMALGNQVRLLDRHTRVGKGGGRRIQRGKESFPALGPERSAAIRDAMRAYGELAGMPDFYRVLDVTYRVAGIGSLYPLKGRLSFEDVRISLATGTREARAELPNPEGRLQPGQFVRVIVHGAKRPNALTVPQRAVLEGPQGKFVYVVDEKSTAQPRPVQVAEWSGDSWVVTEGVKPGERVIVDGLLKLGPGAPVKIAEQKPPAEEKMAQKPAEKQMAGTEKPAAKK